MTEEERNLLLNVDNYEEFEQLLASIDSDYVNSFDLWDEQLLQHYCDILTVSIEENPAVYVPPEMVTDVNVKLG